MRNETKRLEVIGSRMAQQIGNRLVIKGAKAYRRGYDPIISIQEQIDSFHELLMKALVLFHLIGRVRVARTTKPEIKKKLLSFNLYDEATKIAQQRLSMTSEEMQSLRDVYGSRCTTVVNELNRGLEQKLKKAIAHTTEEGMHVKDGMIEIRNAYDAAGVTPKSPYLLENIFRTQTKIAYEAGRWNMLQDEDVQEILWGFEYITAGDGRVRPSHQELDGTKLSKEDSFWQNFWPPNGYQCRCSTVEIFKDEIPKSIIKTNNPQVDIGWNFNSGIVHQDVLKSKELKSISKKKVVKPVIEKSLIGPRVPFKDISYWQKEVTKDEIEAIANYTEEQYGTIKEIQEKLLTGKVKIENLKGPEYIASAKDAMFLEKLIDAGPGFSKEIYRGLRFANKEKANVFLNSIKKDFSFKSLQSFSANLEVASQFSTSKCPVVLRFKKAPKRALDISDFAGHFKSEQEILVGSNSKYKIKKIDSKAWVNKEGVNVTVIDLEEIIVKG